ncbi:MAG: phosphoribosylanthranilate isomerase [Wenzhouxiangella sp.]|jgi:phosphoribosylanthranilate isomerase|nr:phosphoribosylanthranilate isomerase [Wenzhouxiangella sp.]
MTRVKICGITSIEDALAAEQAGVDAIGLVFVPASKRAVSAELAKAICRALGPFVNRVGLFMDAAPDEVENILAQVPIDTLQFHGSESTSFCEGFSRPWIKALAMGGNEPPDWRAFAQADALLLDSHGGGKLGGSGKTFDWGQVPVIERPWILAGGLAPNNVAEACRALRPNAVDVSSGVEIRPGIKDHKAMDAFIKAVKHA